MVVGVVLWGKGGVKNNFNVSLPHKGVIEWLVKKVAWFFFFIK